MTRVLECEACGRRSFYNKSRCLECGNNAFVHKKSGTGTLLSVSTVHVTPEGVREPNKLGLASFSSNANVIAQLGDSVSVGDEVELSGDYELRQQDEGPLRGARLVTAQCSGTKKE